MLFNLGTYFDLPEKKCKILPDLLENKEIEHRFLFPDEIETLTRIYPRKLINYHENIALRRGN